MMRQSRSLGRTVLAIVLATVMLGACDWSQVGFGPGRTNFNPSEPTLTPATVSGLHERWRISVPGMSLLQPLTANGLVYFAVPGIRVAAVSATTGAPAWSSTSDVTSVFAVADGKVYAATQEGLSAFDALTGVEIWSITISLRPPSFGSPPSSLPALSGGLVYVVGLDNRVYAFDAATGTLDWSVAPTSGTLGPGVVVANGVAYVAASAVAAGPNVFALNADTGATIWSATADWSGLPGPEAAFVSMAAGDKAYVVLTFCILGACGVLTQAFDATDGSVAWNAQGYPLAVGDGIMYSTSATYDSATGAQLWSNSASAAAIAHGVIYATTSTQFALLALDAATGTELWRFIFGNLGSPSVANGALYVASASDLIAYGL
jgi:eukaryotic-like serine/threonine-protein kinase